MYLEKHFSKKVFFFQKILCHSFYITVIPSILPSFLPYYRHSFQIIVISFYYGYPFQLTHRITNTSSKSFPYPKGNKNPPEMAIYASYVIRFCQVLRISYQTLNTLHMYIKPIDPLQTLAVTIFSLFLQTKVAHPINSPRSLSAAVQLKCV